MSEPPFEEIGDTCSDPRPANPLFLYFAIQADNQHWEGSNYFGLFSFSGQEGISCPFTYQLQLRANTQPTLWKGAYTPQATKAYAPWPKEPPGASTDHQRPWQVLSQTMLGRPTTVGIARPSSKWPRCPEAQNTNELFDGYQAAFLASLKPGATPSKDVSLFNGILTSFSFSEPGVYTATLNPRLWLLTKTNNYRIVSGSVVEVIATVLKGHGFTEQHDLSKPPQGAQFHLKTGVDWLGSNRKQDWLQAGESDLAFLQRVMGKASIYYYIEQGATGHTVVFSNKQPVRSINGRADSGAAHDPGNTMRYAYTSAQPLGLEQEHVVTQYTYEQSLRTTGVNASFVRQPPVWEDECVAQYTPFRSQASPRKQGSVGSLPFNYSTIVSYGGSEEEVAAHAQHQEEMLSVGAGTLRGTAHNNLFRAGRWFVMSDGDREPGRLLNGEPWVLPAPIRPSLEKSPSDSSAERPAPKFVLTSVKHSAELGGTYQNTFEATELTGLLTPFNMGETQQGSLVGRVVAHPGDTNAPGGLRCREFLPKSAFDYRKEVTDFEDQAPSLNKQEETSKDPAPGVFVKFSTDPQGAAPHWIKISDSSPNVPQVGALVMVGRSRDFNELPEIQQVLDSHGSKTIMPYLKNGQHWQTNTNAGSNFSTSYGDSQSIRYGGNSPGGSGIGPAEKFVNDAYTKSGPLLTQSATEMVALEQLTGSATPTFSNSEASSGPGPGSALAAPTNTGTTAQQPAPTVAAGSSGSSSSSASNGFHDVSYSQGSSCSYSESDKGPDGLLSHSYSRGCSWNSSISAWSTSYSITGKKKDRAKTPTFHPEKFKGVVQGNQSWTHGDTSSISEHHGIARSKSLVTEGQLSASAIGKHATVPAMPTDCVSGSSTLIVGDTKNISVNQGNTNSVSKQTGIRTSNNTLTGSSNDTTVQTGPGISKRTSNVDTSTTTGVSQTSTTTYASTTSTNTTGSCSSMCLTGTQNSMSLTGMQDSLSLTGMSNGLNLTGSQKSLSLTGSQDSLNLTGTATSLGLTGSQTGLNLTGTNTSLGLTGVQTSLNLTGDSTSLNLTGDSTGLNLTGASTQLNLTGDSTTLNLTGTSTSLNLTGPSTSINLSGEATAIDISGEKNSISVSAGGASLELSAPTMTLKAEGLNLNMGITMELSMSGLTISM